MSGAAGLTALSICESMLLSLTKNAVIDPAEAGSILEDAAAAHRGAAPVADGAADDHLEAAAVIEHLLSGGNSVRHGPERIGRTGTPLRHPDDGNSGNGA